MYVFSRVTPSFGAPSFGGFGVTTVPTIDPVRAKIIAMAGPFIGAAKVAEAYDGVVATIEKKAGEGAEAKLKPVIYGLMAASGVAIFTSILAIVVAKRR